MSQFDVLMQEASRQLFERAEAEYAEEERDAANAEEVEEGVPPDPQQRTFPTEPVDPPPAASQSPRGLPVKLHDSFVCYCHEIDWLTPLKNGGDTVYNYTDGTPSMQCYPTEGHEMPCGDRVNLGHITSEQAIANCRYYKWDDPNTKMPQDLIDFFHKWNRENPYDSRFDINHPDHYLNHYQSLRELIDHLQDPSLYSFPPIQGTTDVYQAQADINEIEALKQASLESQQT
jgi:hypothetical protein